MTLQEGTSPRGSLGGDIVGHFEVLTVKAINTMS